MRTHNEEVRVVVTVEPIDIDGLPYTPITARYRVDDGRSEEEMVPFTTLTPSTSMEITIPGPVNTIVNDRNKVESKVVTVNTDDGLATQHNEEYLYGIKNLRFVDP